MRDIFDILVIGSINLREFVEMLFCFNKGDCHSINVEKVNYVYD